MKMFRLLTVFASLMYWEGVFAHGNEDHAGDKKKKEEIKTEAVEKDNDEGSKQKVDQKHGQEAKSEVKTDVKENANAIREIDKEYQAKIRPIFKKACYDCHTNKTKFPWYYNMPFAKQQIDSDIKEAKKHLEIKDSFPFGGHGNPSEDLDAIGKSIDEGTMPPLKYQIMHWSSFLGDDEKEAILQWVKEGKEKLGRD